MLSAVRTLGRVVLQTRHAGARLIGQAEFSAPWVETSPGVFRDAGDQLDFRTALWGRADAFLRVCGCCGSPGRIQVHGQGGADFLQVCATPESDLHRWSDVLTTLCDGAAGTTHADAAPGRTSLRYVGGAKRQAFVLDRFGAWIDQLRLLTTPVRVALCSEEASHSEDLTPERVQMDGAILSISEPGRCAQIAVPLVRQLVIDQVGDTAALHLLGDDDWLLLSFAAIEAPSARSAWEEALHDHFPAY